MYNLHQTRGEKRCFKKDFKAFYFLKFPLSLFAKMVILLINLFFLSIIAFKAGVGVLSNRTLEKVIRELPYSASLPPCRKTFHCQMPHVFVLSLVSLSATGLRL